MTLCTRTQRSAAAAAVCVCVCVIISSHLSSSDVRHSRFPGLEATQHGHMLYLGLAVAIAKDALSLHLPGILVTACSYST